MKLKKNDQTTRNEEKELLLSALTLIKKCVNSTAKILGLSEIYNGWACICSSETENGNVFRCFCPLEDEVAKQVVGYGVSLTQFREKKTGCAKIKEHRIAYVTVHIMDTPLERFINLHTKDKPSEQVSRFK